MYAFTVYGATKDLAQRHAVEVAADVVRWQPIHRADLLAALKLSEQLLREIADIDGAEVGITFAGHVSTRYPEDPAEPVEITAVRAEVLAFITTHRGRS